MPPGPVTPHDLRARAAALRTVASKLDASPALDLHRRAGPEVWEGPTPRRCHDDLLAARTSLMSAAGDLRHGAHFLEQLADHLTPPAPMTPLVPPGVSW